MEELRERARKKLHSESRTQKSLAKAIGFSDAMVSLWLRGKSSSKNVASAVEKWIADEEMDPKDFFEAINQLINDLEANLSLEESSSARVEVLLPEAANLSARTKSLENKWSTMKHEHEASKGMYVLLDEKGTFLKEANENDLLAAYSAIQKGREGGNCFYITQIGFEDTYGQYSKKWKTTTGCLADYKRHYNIKSLDLRNLNINKRITLGVLAEVKTEPGSVWETLEIDDDWSALGMDILQKCDFIGSAISDSLLLPVGSYARSELCAVTLSVATSTARQMSIVGSIPALGCWNPNCSVKPLHNDVVRISVPCPKWVFPFILRHSFSGPLSLS